MKITIEHNDGKETVFEQATDLYVCVRLLESAQEEDGRPLVLPETRSFSWGGNVRELVKELRQSVVELEHFLNANDRK
jgi:transcriptional regulator with PAS, ATPase and Fis domain